MKSARALAAAGAVSHVTKQGPVIQGQVVSGGKTYKAGLRFLGGSLADNLCTCPKSRRDGSICEHSLAVALASLQPCTSPQTDQNTPTSASPPAADHSRPPAPSRDTRGIPASSSWPLFFETLDDTTLPVEVRLILPLNFAQTLAKGAAIHVGVEARISPALHKAETPSRRHHSQLTPSQQNYAANGIWQLASTLLQPHTRYWTPPGQADLWDFLRQLSPHTPPSLLSITPQSFSELVSTCIGSHCLLIGKHHPLHILATPARPQVTVSSDNNGFYLSPSSDQFLLPDCDPPRLISNNSIQPLHPSLPPDIARTLASKATIPWTKATPILEHLQDSLDFSNPHLIPPILHVRPQFTFRLSGSLQKLTLQTDVTPLNHPSPPATICHNSIHGIAWRAKNTILFLPPREITRLTHTLQSFGFQPTHSNLWIIESEPDVLRFFSRHQKHLQSLGHLSFSPTLQRQTSQIEFAQPNLRIHQPADYQTQTNWLEFQCDFSLPSGSPVSTEDLRKLLNSGSPKVKKRDGSFLALDIELADDLRHAIAESGAIQQPDGRILTPASHAEYLQATASQLGYSFTSSHHSSPSLPLNNSLLLQRLQNAKHNLQTTLRAYQEEGLHWLASKLLTTQAALLADEMGLGKTIQALAAAESLSYPILVVCPASLTIQWLQEANKFLPNRKCLLLNKDNILQPLHNQHEHDIFIGSYGIIREYAPRLKSAPFAGIILDEAQAIRNPKSQTRRYLSRFRSSWRLAMTGTPIENRLADLWSILDWLRPGDFGTLNDFLSKYSPTPPHSKPLAPHQDPTHRRLAARIAPIMLRRRIQDVLTELPPKTTQIITCPMTDTQRALYTAIAQETASKISLADLPKQRILALTSLLRLRQTALSPSLLPTHELSPQEPFPGGKWDALLNILTELRENGRKALIFSSFKSALILLNDALTTLGFSTALLHGSTPNRAAEIQKFYTDPSVSLFLVSLKAGGSGLNLAIADAVIHLEPWWNPAAEEQANARAHRIGQSRPVHIYKLISKDSLEEGILALQSRKASIAESVLDTTPAKDMTFMDGLSDQELAELLNLSR